jgi:hypothetical protein
MLDAEKSRAAAGVARYDATSLMDLVDNLEATGRRDRAIEAIFYLVGCEGRCSEQGSDKA